MTGTARGRWIALVVLLGVTIIPFAKKMVSSAGADEINVLTQAAGEFLFSAMSFGVATCFDAYSETHFAAKRGQTVGFVESFFGLNLLGVVVAAILVATGQADADVNYLNNTPYDFASNLHPLPEAEMWKAFALYLFGVSIFVNAVALAIAISLRRDVGSRAR